MSCRWILPFIPVSALVGAAPIDAKPSAPTSRYAKPSQCKDMGSGDINKGEDWVYVRCAGWNGIPVWYICMDSTRCRYGFGRKANLSSGVFGTDGDPNWPIEWRGRMAGQGFEPFAVIMRGRMAGMLPEDGSSLSVFRLRPDGRSCLVGDGIKSNEEARKVADAAAPCFAEPVAAGVKEFYLFGKK